MEILNEVNLFLPAVITAVAGIVTMMMGAYKTRMNTVYWFSVVALIYATIRSALDLFGPMGYIFSDMISYGGTAAFGVFVVMIGTLFTVVFSRDYLTHIRHHYAEVYAMIFFATTGMLVLASSNNLVSLFLGLETMSVSLYVLAGLVKEDKKSMEAALKYFLLGAFATGFLLYGIALLYGASGSTSFQDIAQVTDRGLIYWGGVSLLLVGFFFKISAVPFHMWTPDVYQGSPTTITGYMATAAKSAAIVALVLVLSRALQHSGSEWSGVIQVIAMITMIFGNIIALVQNNIKRMLAYSSIAHAGYALVGLAAGTVFGYQAVLFYLFAYSLMNIGAFAIVAYYETVKGLDLTNIENYAGLGFKQPVMAVMLSIFLFSLAGMPPFIGFAGKYQVFAAAIQQGYVTLAVVGVLTSAAAAYYYLRVMVFMYFRDPAQEFSLAQPGRMYTYALVVLATLTLLLGLRPETIIGLF